MSEVQAKKTWQELNQNREQRLAEWRKDKTLEERLTALETKFLEEDDRLYNVVLPEIDEQISRAITESFDSSNKAHEHYNKTVVEVRGAVQEVKSLVQRELKQTIRELVAKSNSAVVVNALVEALKSMVLVTRQATREELKSRDVLVVRHATPAEIREQH
jgi:NhaP-type Na+/H+ and K+/H+ antiporter